MHSVSLGEIFTPFALGSGFGVGMTTSNVFSSYLKMHTFTNYTYMINILCFIDFRATEMY